MEKKSEKMYLPSLDDLFTNQKTRDEADLEKVVNIKITDIDDFPEHPFKVIVNDELKDMATSIKEKGVLSPALVRKKDNGKYEMISGHRRKKASELANMDTIPCIVRDLTDDEATIIMVDSNMQREKVLPSEKAFAYKMKLDALSHQGKRNDLTSVEIAQKSKTSRQVIAEQVGESEDKLFVILWLLFNGFLKGLNIGNTYLVPIISGTYYLGYFIIGHMIIKYYDQIKRNKDNKLLLITTIISFITVVISTYFISINSDKHFTKLLTYSNALIMIASLTSFIYLYFNIKDKEYIIISKLSNLSFGIYLFHAIILDFMMKLIPYKNIYSYVGIPVILVIVVFITSVIVNILKKTYISRYL